MKILHRFIGRGLHRLPDVLSHLRGSPVYRQSPERTTLTQAGDDSPCSQRRPELKQATTVPARNGGLSHRGSRTPQNKKSRDATMWRLYNYVRIENSLLTACELQIRKNGKFRIKPRRGEMKKTRSKFLNKNKKWRPSHEGRLLHLFYNSINWLLLRNARRSQNWPPSQGLQYSIHHYYRNTLNRPVLHLRKARYLTNSIPLCLSTPHLNDNN